MRGSLPAPLANLLQRAHTVLVPLLIVTLPLEFTQQYSPIAILQASRVVIVACLLTLALQAFFGVREVRLPPARLWLPPVCFVGYAAVSAVILGSSPGFKTVAAMVIYGLMALAIYNWSSTRPDQERFWTCLAISVIGLAILGLILGSTGAYIWNAPNAGYLRVNATFKDPNIYARFLIFGAVTSLVLASRSRSPSRPLFIAALVLASAALPFTFSRQGWVVGALVLAVAVVVAAKRLWAAGLAVLGAGTFAAVALLDPEIGRRWKVLGQILTTPPGHVSDNPMFAFLNVLPLDATRRYLVEAGLQMFYDHPIFGVGFGNFPAAMLGAYHDFIPAELTTIDSHTSFVTIVAELGIIGLALATWWFYELTRSTVKSARSPERRDYVVAAFLALLLILLASQFEGRLIEEPYLWLFIGVALGAQRLQDHPEGASSPDQVVARLAGKPDRTRF